MDPKMEEALSKWWDEPRPPDGFHWSADKRSFRAGYKAALADNAELVRQHKLDADTAIDSLREAEEQLAEARATIERVEVLRRYDLVETARGSSYESYRDMRADVTGEWVKLEDLVEALKPVKS